MGKVALVTGASRGIGKAVALGLAQDGFDIWLNYHSSHEAALSVKHEIESIGQSCSMLCFNVADGPACKEVLGKLLQKQTPEVLVNNAGFTRDAIFGLMSDEEWDCVLDVHLNGFYHVTRQIVPYMIHQRKGRIISIVSVSGQTGNAGQVNYSAAKAGLIGATKALARELGKRNILVNAVAPGLIKTEMTDTLSTREYVNAIPLNRMGTAEEVAGCVRFLCSDWASYVTGQVLAVNGGLYL
ncbi:3-oxoacyl-ACP reductase FabG [uncultured Mailhella sp.]|uniref:3-oxoacyl-ACP reductase FabG n=1 Tax=uncultured Mailhella sp. TaxID=1981031 RepID=UPI002601E0D3|nr:3-oxoacyl-ACP reductase FabG [uncultured Mailhella sp.]